MCRAALRFRAERVEREIAVSENGGEEIIEVVRDSARELAERFHFLRTQNLILQLFARRDIHERTDEALRHAGSIADDQCALEQDARKIRPRDETDILPTNVHSSCAMPRRCSPSRARDLRDEFFPSRSGVRFCVLGGVAEQAFQALRPGERAASYIPNPNRIICSPRGQRKILSVLKRCSCK